MPALVGGFGNLNCSNEEFQLFYIFFKPLTFLNIISKRVIKKFFKDGVYFNYFKLTLSSALLNSKECMIDKTYKESYSDPSIYKGIQNNVLTNRNSLIIERNVLNIRMSNGGVWCKKNLIFKNFLLNPASNLNFHNCALLNNDLHPEGTTCQSSKNEGGKFNSQLGPYLAGLIEGDGTFAVHEEGSTAKKYAPMIIIVFKKSDLPLAEFLRDLTNSGKVYIKPERGYILWQIQDLISVYTIINIINGHMRTPKIEALDRTIKWFNNYIDKNEDSKLTKTQKILSQITKLETYPLDLSKIESNSWFAGFSDADANFSINIHKRSNKDSTRVQLYYRLEIRQNYHRFSTKSIYQEPSYFPLMSEIAKYLGVNVYSRSRDIKDKIYYSYTVISHNKNSNLKIIDYFNKFPLLSSKFLDYSSFKELLKLQTENSLTSTYLEKAINIRKDFNKTRTTYNWDHIKNCYLGWKD